MKEVVMSLSGKEENFPISYCAAAVPRRDQEDLDEDEGRNTLSIQIPGEV